MCSRSHAWYHRYHALWYRWVPKFKSRSRDLGHVSFVPLIFLQRSVLAVKRYMSGMNRLTNFKLDTDLVIKAGNNWRDVGRLQVEMHVAVAIFSSYFFSLFVWHFIWFGLSQQRKFLWGTSNSAMLSSVRLRTHTHGLAVDICPSVCQTRALRQNEIIVCRYFNTIRQSDVSSLLRPNFIILRLGVHPERVCQREVPLCRKRKFDQ